MRSLRYTGRMRFGWIGGFRRSHSGSAALELAVITPFLVLLLIGVVDYGRVFYTSVTVSNAARSGAEYGAQSPITSGDTIGMKNFAQGDGQEAGTLGLTARRYCECGGAAHSCDAVCTSGAAPDVFVEVKATKKVGMLFRYPGLLDTVTVSRMATFRSQ